MRGFNSEKPLLKFNINIPSSNNQMNCKNLHQIYHLWVTNLMTCQSYQSKYENSVMPTLPPSSPPHLAYLAALFSFNNQVYLSPIINILQFSLYIHERFGALYQCRSHFALPADRKTTL